jgi:hypothetical protein
MSNRLSLVFCLLSSGVLAQHKIDFNIAYPFTGRFPTTGLLSADVRYGYQIKDNGTFLAIGPFDAH